MFRISLLKLIFSGIIILFLPTLLSAHQSPNLKIIAIVLSKTCPLPDGPGMTIDSPDSIIKSVNNPDCPKHGDTQLVQTAIANHAKIQIKVGVEIKVRVDNQELKKRVFAKFIRFRLVTQHGYCMILIWVIPAFIKFRLEFGMLNSNGY